MKLVDSPISLELREHVNYEQLVAMLNISKHIMFQIIQLPEFPKENGTYVSQDWIFHLAKVKRYLERFNKFSDYGCIEVAVNDRRFAANLTSYDQMIIDVLTNKLEGQIYHMSLSKICVDPEDFEIWLKAKRHEACQSPIDIVKDANMIEKSNDEVRQLIKKGNLHCAPWDRYLNMIDGQSLRLYLYLEVNSVWLV